MKQRSSQAKEVRVFFTGGHARITGFAVAQEVLKRHPDWKLYWVGSKVSHVGTNYKSLESKIFPEMGIEFLPIIAGRVQRNFTFWTIPELFKIPVGFFHALYFLLKYKPDLLVSFGSFTSIPLVFMSKLMGIPILIHEQTAAIGRANLVSAPFASVVALARQSSLKFVKPGKAVVIGNPVSSDIRHSKPKSHIGNPPILLVTGGASGAKRINDAVKSVLSELLENFVLIHQTGDLEYETFTTLKSGFSKSEQERYQVFPALHPEKMHELLNGADIVVSRSGANIVSELIYLKKPCVLIPLPLAYKDEQNQNAEIAKEFGVAKVLPQKSLSGESLKKAIYEIKENWEKINRGVVKKVSSDTESHTKFADIIEKLVR